MDNMIDIYKTVNFISENNNIISWIIFKSGVSTVTNVNFKFKKFWNLKELIATFFNFQFTLILKNEFIITINL